jgi:hypothetical protein
LLGTHDVFEIVEVGYVEPENISVITVQQMKLLNEKRVADKISFYVILVSSMYVATVISFKNIKKISN